MLKRAIILVVLTMGAISCNRPSEHKTLVIEHDYVVETLYENRGTKELWETDYYRNDTLVLNNYGRDGFITGYFYNDHGQLKETRSGRTQRVNYFSDSRNVYIYDEHGNHLGSVYTDDPDTPAEDLSFDQTSFYDNQNRLVKKLTDTRQGPAPDYEKYHIWTVYSYIDDKIDHMIELWDADTLWIGKYSYDEHGWLSEIYKTKTRRDVYLKETYKYDEGGRLIEKIVEGNEYPITPATSFIVTNNKTVFEYDSTGFKTSKTVYSHKGEVSSKALYVKRLNTTGDQVKVEIRK